MAQRTPLTVRLRRLTAVGGPDDCWLWLGSLDTGGYGKMNVLRDGRSVTTGAHRVAYELHVGPIPKGLVVDHLCRCHACVNPAHLEPVTNEENIRRGVAWAQAAGLSWRTGSRCGPRPTYPMPWLVRKTNDVGVAVCRNGHEMTPENTYRRPSRSDEAECRACRALARIRYHGIDRATLTSG